MSSTYEPVDPDRALPDRDDLARRAYEAGARGEADAVVVARLADEALAADAAGNELALDALRGYNTDAVVHMRAKLAAQVTEQTTAAGRTVAGLRRDGYERAAQDLAAALRQSAAIALHLVDQPLPGDHRPPARELAAGVVGGFLAEHGAPDPVTLARRLLEELERAGLAFTHRPGSRAGRAAEDRLRAAVARQQPRYVGP